MTHRCYYSGPIHSSVTLSPDKSHHLLHVLRLKKNEPLILFNGDGHEYTAQLTNIEKKLAILSITEAKSVSTESAFKIHLGQAVSAPERMDFSIQKAVELGVDKITPIWSQFCQIKFSPERLQKKITHWQNIAVSAAEQCGRTSVPEILQPQNFVEWSTKRPEALKLIAHHKVQYPIPSPKTAPISGAVLIGPEGGFTDQEVELAKQQDFEVLTLGPRVLRTETAPIVALTLLQYLWGDI